MLHDSCINLFSIHLSKPFLSYLLLNLGRVLNNDLTDFAKHELEIDSGIISMSSKYRLSRSLAKNSYIDHSFFGKFQI